MISTFVLYAALLNKREMKRSINIQKKFLRNSSDPFTLSNKRFISLFRLNKDMVYFLIESLGQYLLRPASFRTSRQIEPRTKVFAACLFFAKGLYQKTIGNILHVAMSQQSISRSVCEVAQLIVTHLADKLIKFPVTSQEKDEIKRNFKQEYQFPGVVGCINCTHIALKRPKAGQNYLNEKGFNSLNVQIVCDSHLRILHINPKNPGSSDNCTILMNSEIKDELEKEDSISWLLGNSKYPQEKWLMTPIANALDDSPEERYNKAHAAAWSCIQRCIGVLKGRFHCLSGKALLYTPEKVAILTQACAVLHNMCVNAKMDLEPDHVYDDNDELSVCNNFSIINEANRKLLVETYFKD